MVLRHLVFVFALGLLVLAARAEIGFAIPGNVRNGPRPPTLGMQFTTIPTGMDGFRYEAVVNERTALLAQQPEPYVENAATENDCDLTMNGGTESGFMFSESYLSSDEACTSAGQVPCYSADELISAPNTGLYTSFTFAIENSVANFGSDQSISQQFDYVASDIGSTCATITTTCPDGSACDGIFRTTIDITIKNLKIGYRLQRMCFTPNGMTSSTFSSCPFPFSYLAQGSDSSLDAACTAQNVAAETCFGEDAQLADYSGTPVPDGTLPCDGTVVGAPLDVSELDVQCGTNRDEDTNFIDALNQQCISACCSACAAEGFADPQYHQRWGIGPYSFAYNILPADRFLADIDITVTVRNEDTGATDVRTISMLDIDEGTTVMDATDQVRVTVNSIAQDVFNATPKLSQGMIVVWDDEGATSNGIIFQTASPEINPNSLLPNNGFGLTPTKRNYNSTSGWAWFNTTRLYGPGPGQYGASQEMVTSATSQFGATQSCYNDYYTDHHLLPGWQRQKSNPNLPVVESPCYVSHLHNSLTDQILGAVSPDLWVGREHVPPNTDLSFFNWYLYGNLLIYDVRTEASNGDKDFLVTDTSGASANPDRIQDLFQLRVDVSADLARYSANVGGAAFGTASGCLYDIVEGQGELVISVTNTNQNGVSAATFTVQTTCTTTDTSLLTVTNLQPENGASVALNPGSTRYVQPNFLFQLENATSTTNYTVVPTVYCSCDIFAEGSSVIPLSSKAFQCFNARAGLETQNNTQIIIDKVADRTCTGSEAECNTATYWWVWATIGVVLFVSIVLAFILILYCCLEGRSTKKKKDAMHAENTAAIKKRQ